MMNSIDYMSAVKILTFFHELQEAYELKEYYIQLSKMCPIQGAPEAIDNAISTFSNAGI